MVVVYRLHSSEVFSLVFAFWLIYRRKLQASEFGLRTQSVFSFIATFLIVTLLGTLIDQNEKLLIATLPGYPPFGGMPEIMIPAWNWIDLSFGLLMVGICEELVLRGFLYTFISRYTKNTFAIVILSSVAFGFIHWSLGMHAVIIASAIQGDHRDTLITELRNRGFKAKMAGG